MAVLLTVLVPVRGEGGGRRGTVLPRVPAALVPEAGDRVSPLGTLGGRRVSAERPRGREEPGREPRVLAARVCPGRKALSPFGPFLGSFRVVSSFFF